MRPLVLLCVLACRGEPPPDCDYDLGDYCNRLLLTGLCSDLPQDVVTNFDQTGWYALRQCGDLYEVTDLHADKEATVLVYYSVETRDVVGVAVYPWEGPCDVELYGEPMPAPCASDPIVQWSP